MSEQFYYLADPVYPIRIWSKGKVALEVSQATPHARHPAAQRGMAHTTPRSRASWGLTGAFPRDKTNIDAIGNMQRYLLGMGFVAWGGGP